MRASVSDRCAARIGDRFVAAVQGSNVAAFRGDRRDWRRRHERLGAAHRRRAGGSRLAKTAVKPTPHEEENDPAFIRDVWLKASSGAPIGQWERELNTDSYRVRRIVAHWLEQGALIGA
jgi:hypothetical protein